MPAVRLALPVLALALALPAAGAEPASVQAASQRTDLAPGLVLQRLVRPDGQVVHVLRMRRSPGVLDLEPVLLGGSTQSVGSLSRHVRDRLPAGTLAGINGDLFNFVRSYPSGVFARGAEPVSEPEAGRSAAVMPPEGALMVTRLGMTARWQVVDPAAPPAAPMVIHGLNRPEERSSETVLYTAASGAATPSGRGWEVTVALDGGALPLGGVVDGTVVGARTAGRTAIGPGQVVLRGVGTAQGPLRTALPAGRRVRLSVAFPGLPPGALWAIGGGPLLVRDGVAVADAGETFTIAQRGARTQRSALGQTADGTLLMVVAEGADQGSPGLTVPEQARLMADLGARSAIAFDGGGSAQLVALGSQVVARRYERPLSNALVVTYRGAAVAPLGRARLSPNGDGIDDRIPVTVHAGDAGRVDVVLARRGGGARRLGGGAGPGRLRVGLDPKRLGVPDGPYAVVARLTPAAGGPPRIHRQELVIDRTLARLRASGRPARTLIRFTLVRPAARA
ncbi:MAG TPA: phosphodiester glycosidase family protein [Miltoncostaeaceae bacterium]|nr:phosphodiester glycosidase family protein [Miltoncostaeaceae bacterium]